MVTDGTIPTSLAFNGLNPVRINYQGARLYEEKPYADTQADLRKHIDGPLKMTVSNLYHPHVASIFMNNSHNEKYFKLKFDRHPTWLRCDLKQAYKNGLSTYNKEPWCVFDVDAYPVECNKIGDVGYYFVEITNKGFDSNVLFGINSTSWLYRSTIQSMAKMGFRFRVMYYLKPSGTIEPDYYTKMIDNFVAGGDPDSQENKHAIRYLSGMLRRYKGYSDSKARIDCPDNLETLRSRYNSDDFRMMRLNDKYSVAYELKRTILWSNYLPIANQMLENVLVARYKMGKFLKIEPKDIYATNCDEIIAIKLDLKPGTYTHDGIVFTVKEDETHKNRWKDNDRIDDPVGEKTDYVFEPIVWNDRSNTLVDKDDSVVYTGLAGTGKTYTMKQDPRFNDPTTARMAFTNRSAVRIEGKTIHRTFKINLEGEFSNKDHLQSMVRSINTILVDEFGQMPKMCWNLMALIKAIKPEMKFIMAGDNGQCPPVDGFGSDISRSALLHWLVGGNSIDLKENMRCDEGGEEMFQIYNTLVYGKRSVDVSKFVKGGETKINLCWTNAMVMEINQRMNIHTGKFITKYAATDGKEDKRCDMWIYKGLPLCCIIGKEGEYVNSSKWIVDDYDEEHITMIDVDDGEMITITVGRVARDFQLGYACTIDRSQGDTISEPYTIWEWSKMTNCKQFNRMYTALSRTSSINNISINY